MLFSTPFFIFVFLPIFFLLYAVFPRKSAILLLGSLLFYGWGEPLFVFIFLFSACLDWLLGWQIIKHGVRGKAALCIAIAINLGLIVYSKYVGFGVENLNAIMGFFKLESFEIPEIALPLGVSFIVFEKITYVVDLHRGTAKPAKSLVDYLNYTFLFPKLLAGPIVKYNEINKQLEHPKHSFNDVKEGFIRFCIGLGKKMLIADFLSIPADHIFGMQSESLDPATAWLGLTCYTLQIYFDFSGYSDMAIGLCRMIGFKIPENFRNPYLSTSFTDFWRRWHISLSTWIKDYLYIPLGGSRVSKARSYLNLCICFFLSGLWHGASWNFIIWGCFHGIGLVFDRLFWIKWQVCIPRFINTLITLFFVAISWVFFRCETLGGALSFLTSLFRDTSSLSNDFILQDDTKFILVIAILLVSLPAVSVPKMKSLLNSEWVNFGKLVLAAFILLACIAWMAMETSHPFLYFRF